MKKLYLTIALLCLGAQESMVFGMGEQATLTGFKAGLAIALSSSLRSDCSNKRIEKILKAGANPNFAIQADPIAPILATIFKNNASLCKLLLEYGANPNAAIQIEKDLMTALTLATGSIEDKKSAKKEELEQAVEIMIYLSVGIDFYGKGGLPVLKSLTNNAHDAKTQEALKVFAHAAIKTQMAKLKEVYLQSNGSKTSNTPDNLETHTGKQPLEMSSKELIAFIVQNEGPKALVKYLEKGWLSNEPTFVKESDFIKSKL